MYKGYPWLYVYEKRVKSRSKTSASFQTDTSIATIQQRIAVGCGYGYLASGTKCKKERARKAINKKKKKQTMLSQFRCTQSTKTKENIARDEIHTQLFQKVLSSRYDLHCL